MMLEERTLVSKAANGFVGGAGGLRTGEAGGVEMLDVASATSM